MEQNKMEQSGMELNRVEQSRIQLRVKEQNIIEELNWIEWNGK